MECEIASLLEKAPQLVKLGISLEFRETLNKTALQLQKNLDQSTNLQRLKSIKQSGVFGCYHLVKGSN
jgi:hypothetical protein